MRESGVRRVPIGEVEVGQRVQLGASIPFRRLHILTAVVDYKSERGIEVIMANVDKGAGTVILSPERPVLDLGPEQAIKGPGHHPLVPGIR